MSVLRFGIARAVNEERQGREVAIRRTEVIRCEWSSFASTISSLDWG